MKFCILMGSPRPKGNTAALLEPFTDELKRLGTEVTSISLYKKDLRPCIACRTCQDVPEGFGCPVPDDMQEVYDAVSAADCFVLASPIYSWFCTPPMKAVLDRLVYGMNKYYGEARTGSLWQGKRCAIFTTCGYKITSAVDVFELGVSRYCKHSRLHYEGLFAARDKGYKAEFMTDAKRMGAVAFAGQLFSRAGIPVEAEAPPLAVHVAE